MFFEYFQEQIKKAVAAFKNEISGIRSNRPTGKLVEDIKVDYFGQQLLIKQLASIGVVPPREIHISVWDKNAVAPVAKAIEAASIGAGANIQGNTVIVNLPPLSEERRKEMVKLAKSVSEEHRIRVRSLRDDCNKKVRQAEADKSIAEDAKFKLQDKIQKEVDRANQEIEKSLNSKIAEIES